MRPLSAIAAALLLVLASADRAAAQPLVVIDPGHGGRDPGAVGCGLEEAPMALDVSRRLGELLEGAGLRVRLSRTTDTYVSLDGRTSLANSIGATRFVSIHNNASSPPATGTETFMYTSGSSQSRDLRDRIQRQMIMAWMLADRGGKTADFYVLRNTSMPATLSELAFINRCSPDAALIGDPAKRQIAAEAHFRAITAHLGIEAMVPPAEGRLHGVVFEDVGLGEEDTSRRLPGARVTIEESGATIDAAEATGEWEIMLAPGTYTVSASLDGFEPAERTCMLAGAETLCSIGLVRIATAADAGPPPARDAGPIDEPDAGTIGPRPGGKVEGGCSAAGALPSSPALPWLGVVLALVTTIALRRRRAAPVLAATLASLAIAACDRAPAPRSTGALEAPRGAGTSDLAREPALEAGALPAEVAEPFATLRDDRVVVLRELAGAVISPDGERIALSGPGFRGLSVHELATGAEIEITSAERAGWLPVWRRDGTAIAFRADGQSGSAIPLHTVTIDGRAIAPFERGELPHFVDRDDRIVRIDAGGARAVSPAIEGERFLMPLRSPDRRHVVWLGLSTGLYVHHVETARTVALGAGAQPAFSADGRFLVFARSDDDGHRLIAGDLFITSLGGSYPTAKLTDTPDRIERSPSLDATAQRIAYLDDVTSALHVAELDVDDATWIGADGGGALTPHTHSPGTPEHEHPHAATDDPWHVTLGH